MTTEAGREISAGTQAVGVRRYSGYTARDETDQVIREEPLAVYVASGPVGARRKELLSMALRTPGADFDLVTGFLFAEHIISHPEDFVSLRFTGMEDSGAENSLLAELHPSVRFDPSAIRNFALHTACSYCSRNRKNGLWRYLHLYPTESG